MSAISENETNRRKKRTAHSRIKIAAKNFDIVFLQCFFSNRELRFMVMLKKAFQAAAMVNAAV